MLKVMHNFARSHIYIYIYIGIAIFLASLISLGLIFNSNINSTHALNSADMEASVTIKPSLTLSIPTNTITMTLDPSTHAFDEKDLTVKVGTNNFTGYKLYVNTTGADLVNVADNTKTIPNLTSSVAPASFPANNWGYRITQNSSSSSGDYGAFTPGSIISQSSGPVNEKVSTLGFAAKVDYTKPSGLYQLNLEFKALPIVTQDYMQDITADMCTEDPKIVIDNRDENPYLIQRLDDGKCWMLDNLNLDLTNQDVADALTPSNTNADAGALNSLRNGARDASHPQYATSGLTYSDWQNTYASYSVPLVNKNGACSTTAVAPCAYDGNYTNNTVLSTLTPNSVFGNGSGRIGMHYNYCAASAGSYCYGDGGTDYGTPSGDSNYDICPAGWRLPTGDSNGDFQTLYNIISAKYPSTAQDSSSPYSYQSIASLLLSGTAVYDQDYDIIGHWLGSLGILWSSTKANNRAMIYQNIDTSSVALRTNGARIFGWPVRCILKDTRTLSDISTMQEMTQDIVQNTAAGSSKVLTDVRDNRTYTVKKLADGNIWMTDNLQIGYTNTPQSTYSINVNPIDTNVRSNKTLVFYDLIEYGDSGEHCYSFISSTTFSGDGFVKTCAHPGTDDVGGSTMWYNYAAATAGTIAGLTGITTAATEDICPAGWKIPTSAQQTTLSLAIGTTPASFNPVYGGIYINGSDNNTRNIRGHWWSSDTSTSTDYPAGTLRLNMRYSEGKLLNAGGHVRTYGLYVRCVAR